MSSASRQIRQALSQIGMESTEVLALDKEKETRRLVEWMLNRTAEMFEYENLPETIPQDWLERLLQCHGMAIIAKTGNTPVGFGSQFMPIDARSLETPLYAFYGSFADAPDPTLMPYKVVVTNPGFRPTLSETWEINKDCVVIRNDSSYAGVLNIHKKYAALITEAEISIRSTLIVLRDNITFQVQTEAQRKAVQQYFADKEAGKFATILAPNLAVPIQAYPDNHQGNSVELAVNGRQALYTAWAHEIGIEPTATQKREYMSAQQIDQSTDALLPIIDNMFRCREMGIDAVNKLFGTNITVKRSSAWEYKFKQAELNIEQIETEIENGGEDNELHSTENGVSDVGDGRSDIQKSD